jgi:hypothetical protein
MNSSRNSSRTGRDEKMRKKEKKKQKWLNTKKWKRGERKRKMGL